MTRGRRALGAAALLVVGMLGACGQPGAGERVGTGASTTSGSVPVTGPPGSAPFLDRCPTSRTDASPRGDGLPSLTLPCLGPGGDVQLAGLRGPRLVNVWASWCGPCRSEMPWLQAAYRSGLDVLGVDSEDQGPAAAALLGDLGVRYPSVFDPDNSFAHAIGVPSKPTTLFVTRDGEVAYVKVGPFASVDELHSLVEQYLQVRLQ